MAVYPEVIVASARSKTAFVISETYARVGLGLVCIDSTICVATMANFPALMHFVTMSFCNSMIFSKGVSMPKSPLATMTPSLASTISSMFYKACLFSTLLIILTLLLYSTSFSANIFRICSMSLLYLAKDTAMKSTLYLRPNSTISFSS